MFLLILFFWSSFSAFLNCVNLRTLSFVTSLFILCHLFTQPCLTLCDSMGHQAPMSMGFSRQEHWSWLPVPSLYFTYLLLLPSRFSHVRPCATPLTAAHLGSTWFSACLGFSRHEHWSGSPFPSPMHEGEKWKWSCSVCPTLCDPMGCSPPGSSIHRIF